MDWIVYGLICEGDKTYIGITYNWTRRFLAHSSGSGAKFTRSFPPKVGRILKRGLTKSEALKLEIQYKKFPRHKKISMILGFDL